MLAVSFARRDRAAASAVLSDALGIAVVLGCGLAAALYAAAPAALAAIAGEASRDVIAPALSYVRIRCTPHTSAKEPVEYTCRLSLRDHVAVVQLQNLCGDLLKRGVDAAGCCTGS